MYNDDCSHFWGGAGTCLSILVFCLSIPLVIMIWKVRYPVQYQKYQRRRGESPGIIVALSSIGALTIFLVFNFVLPLFFCL